jgi:hypothetical protein
MPTRFTEAELDELAAAPEDVDLTLENERGRAWVRPDERARTALRAVPRLVAEVRRLRARVEGLEGEQDRLAKEAKRTARPEPARREVEDASPASEELGSLLAAPFRVSPKAAAAAKDDPLAALAIQVARGLAEDASEVDRARLIAMAFAAAEGNLEGFWQARRQRSLGKLKVAGD